MLIIVEGADKQGKTSLAKYLASEYKLRYLHAGPPTGNIATQYIDQLGCFRGDHVVLDRSFIGELVYGPLLRQKSGVDPLQLDVLCRYANMLGAVVVHAEQRAEIRKKWHEDDEDLGINDTVNEEAVRRFQSVMSLIQRRLPVMHYSHSTIQGRAKWVKEHEFIFRLRNVQARDFLQGIALRDLTGYGAARPIAVLVGEELSPSNQWVGLPFDGGPASRYLSQCLEVAADNQRELYFLNARKDGKWQPAHELRHLQDLGPKFVALGKVASRWLVDHSVPHQQLEHPQYRKRFKLYQTAEYVQQLREALA